MDIDYMNGFRCFTFDQKRFPDPKSLVNDLHEIGIKAIWMLDPGIKNEDGYFVYDSGSERDLWVQTADGKPFVGEVWPGAGPDIGGFSGNATPKLFRRWMGVGSLFPFCRGHSETDTIDHEPWSFGEECEEVFRLALKSDIIFCHTFILCFTWLIQRVLQLQLHHFLLILKIWN